MSYQVRNQYIYKTRKLRVICVGAGLSGIAAVYKLSNKHADLDIEFQIYEKNHDVGGTWLENRYPGCACDVPAHSVVTSHSSADFSTRIPGKEIQIGVAFTLGGKRSGSITRNLQTNMESTGSLAFTHASRRLSGIRNYTGMIWRSWIPKLARSCMTMPKF